MAKEEREEDGPLTITEEWRASLVGLQLQFQKQMLSVLIDKGLLTGEEARLIMFDLAERLRHGSDLAARFNRRGIFVMAGLF
jgi:hypothetical protein